MGDQRETESDSDVGQPPVSPVPAAEGRQGLRKIRSKKTSLEEEGFLVLLHGSDPVKIEINRLENEVKEKDRELTEAHSEIRALKLTERAKEKALAEVTEELEKMAEKLQISEANVETKKLEIKRISEEKKEALAAQFAAEATLRRVHAARKDEELPPLELILSPLEAEIKRLRQEVSKLQDDNRALERMTKSKEAALLEAEKEVHLAKVKVAHVDDLQNRNQELMKQNEICQEEYKILDRMQRQKVAEVEKLSMTVRELEEALLSGAAAANAVRDYQRQLGKLKEEKKTLERTLSRAKVKENRVAVVIANEWKEADDKVIPIRQWLEERRVLMGEMQQLRERLSISERAARTEAQLKEKFQLRLKVVEDSLKASAANGGAEAASLGGLPVKKSQPPPPSWRSTSRSRRSAATPKPPEEADAGGKPCPETAAAGDAAGDGYVSSALYDVLQKEVVCLRRACQDKDQNLRDRDGAIEVRKEYAKNVHLLRSGYLFISSGVARAGTVEEGGDADQGNGGGGEEDAPGEGSNGEGSGGDPRRARA
ncbi:unnamed protein product [Spirodela intermedia]|uniref:Uncharacterized protein n=1 Tax=Spirodela intermedia TaxID=51605 RepID=A0A7I8JWY1_SPIIN|nr:unnamed protein product [Spirodela intermedia]